MALALPAILAARADLRPPWVSGLVLLVGLGLAAHGWSVKPGGYDGESFAQALYGVIGRLLP